MPNESGGPGSAKMKSYMANWLASARKPTTKTSKAVESAAKEGGVLQIQGKAGGPLPGAGEPPSKDDDDDVDGTSVLPVTTRPPAAAAPVAEVVSGDCSSGGGGGKRRGGAAVSMSDDGMILMHHHGTAAAAGKERKRPRLRKVKKSSAELSEEEEEDKAQGDGGRRVGRDAAADDDERMEDLQDDDDGDADCVADMAAGEEEAHTTQCGGRAGDGDDKEEDDVIEEEGAVRDKKKAALLKKRKIGMTTSASGERAYGGDNTKNGNSGAEGAPTSPLVEMSLATWMGDHKEPEREETASGRPQLPLRMPHFVLKAHHHHHDTAKEGRRTSTENQQPQQQQELKPSSSSGKGGGGGGGEQGAVEDDDAACAANKEGNNVDMMLNKVGNGGGTSGSDQIEGEEPEEEEDVPEEREDEEEEDDEDEEEKEEEEEEVEEGGRGEAESAMEDVKEGGGGEGKKEKKTEGVKTTRAKSSKAPAKENNTKNPHHKAVNKKGAKDPRGGVGDGLLALAVKHGDFDAKKAATWKEGEEIPFLFLAQAFDRIANESGRLAMTEILCNVFRTVIATRPEDLLAIVYLAANRVAPPHEGIELGIGDATIIKTIAEATGRKEAQIKADLKEAGDLGLVAKVSRTTQRMMFTPKPLTCVKVLEAFRFIAKESGQSSVDKKRARMKQLLVAARECEPQYIVRLLQGKMRIGLAEQTVLAALAQAVVLSEDPRVPPAQLPRRLEESMRVMKQVYSVLPDYGRVVPALLEVGVERLPDVCRFCPGVPVGPMLAKPTRGISEILDKFQGLEFTSEFKYDGERAQIHYLENGTVEIFSRNAERNTDKFPDIIDGINRYKKPEVTSFVLDCEVVAYNRETNKILPFQALSTRARKGVIMSDIKVQVCLFAFDLLHINGQDLLQEQLITRRQLLYDAFVPVKGEFQFATSVTTSDIEEIQAFLEDAVNNSCEGLMLKTLCQDATYEPAKRSNNWLKLKKDYMDNLGDSLDLVPIGAFHGRGKRAGVYGAFLLACYDDNAEEYQSICKIGTGFSEAMLEERSASLRARAVDKPRPYYRFGESLVPDVWFEPAEVWEVRAADLSISPVHRAADGLVDASKGIALRFPRFLRVRDDKQPEAATSAEQVAEMYRAQKISHHNTTAPVDD